MDEGEEEEQDLDRLASRWLQGHKPDDPYRAVCNTDRAEVYNCCSGRCRDGLKRSNRVWMTQPHPGLSSRLPTT
jgi:hypothetical protein